MRKRLSVDLVAGRQSGIGIGFNISKYYTNFEILFWFIGIEYSIRDHS